MTDKFRQEHKYSISTGTLALLKTRLPLFLRPDEHAGADGSYFIRSLYFDDPERSAFREKLDGVAERVKYRLRFYDFDESFIVFEKKERLGTLCRKTSSVVDRATASRMARGLPSGGGDGLLDEFDAIRAVKGLRPAVIVDYRRWAFVSDVSDTRVTLDAGLASPVWSTDLFSRALPSVPAFDPGEALVEFKFDSSPPAYAAELLEGIPKVKMALSKYTRCLAMQL